MQKKMISINNCEYIEFIQVECLGYIKHFQSLVIDNNAGNVEITINGATFCWRWYTSGVVTQSEMEQMKDVYTKTLRMVEQSPGKFVRMYDKKNIINMWITATGATRDSAIKHVEQTFGV